MNQIEQPVLRLIAEHVELRPWRQDDAQTLVDASLDPDIQQWSRPGRDVSLDDARAKIARWHVFYSAGSALGAVGSSLVYAAAGCTGVSALGMAFSCTAGRLRLPRQTTEMANWRVLAAFP
ncbi:hypothetical protein AV521_03440 [Streptomyces sp. IMTB 2501]|nr:hypothetical protein AV521_03440 [Streptomyces sp. IMTB 2501]